MKKIKWLLRTICILLGLTVPIITFIVFTIFDISLIWDSWGVQPNGDINYPNYMYFSMIFFKLSIYFIPPALFAMGNRIENKQRVERKIFQYYFINALNAWFLFLLITKLFADTIFETDRIFNITLFNSIKDIQTLIGFVLTVILKRKINIEPDKLAHSKST
ncbi:MAG: hypothetical protein LBP62_03460 [Clostridiales bacterium]|nr:hypothetical protein [Clostridiales bacterium]